MPSQFENLARGVAWDALVGTHGRKSTASDAITLGATSASQVAVDCVFIEDDVVPEYREDGKVVVAAGEMTVIPADASGVAATWEAVIDSQVWAVKRIAERSPRLVLDMVRYEEKRVGGGKTYRDL